MNEIFHLFGLSNPHGDMAGILGLKQFFFMQEGQAIINQQKLICIQIMYVVL